MSPSPARTQPGGDDDRINPASSEEELLEYLADKQRYKYIEI